MFQKGYKQTDKHKHNLSLAHTGMKKPWAKPPHYSGEKNPMFGKPMPESRRLNVIKANTGRIPWNKGKKMTDKLRKELSLAHIGKMKGDKNPRWKGGVSSENHKIRESVEIRLWRESVFARDNWTDQKTGIKGERLVAHHIRNFSGCPELRTSIENGITFSKKTHDKFHKIYGYRDNNREQIEDFLSQ